MSILGVTSDGRLAVRLDGGDLDHPHQAVHLVRSGQRLGPALASGAAADVAVAFPNDARGY
ncbi:hypothetical protein [Patulibacter minatonensis]|uniref:hypothetical protein n=1 Tax=Patulibacter minatonensis TaxID=298163 RepID=UPI00047B873E|nr:hypothetical protein [Patulibacter minatonensis]